MILEPIQCSCFTLRNMDFKKDKKSYIKSINNPNIAKGITINLPYTEEYWQQYIKYVKNIQVHPRSFIFVLDVDGEVVGNINLQGNSKSYNKHEGTLGYFLAEEYWGKGIMTEAVRVLSELAFSKYDFKKLIIPTFEYNIGSQKVAEKNDFKYAYTDEKAICKDGENYLNLRYYHKFNNI